VRAFFNWVVVQRRRLKTSPMHGMKPPGKERERDRVLGDDELRWFWQGCDKLGWPFGPLFKLLLLAAQRRDEVAGMERAEVDVERRMWTIPPQRMKRDLEQQVHLSEATLAVLRPVLARTRASKRLIFTTTRETQVSGFSRAKGPCMTCAGPRRPEWRGCASRRTSSTVSSRTRKARSAASRASTTVSNTSRSGVTRSRLGVATSITWSRRRRGRT
jgi:integrase